MPRARFAFLLGLLVLSGCLDDYPNGTTYEPVDAKIRVGMQENLGAGSKTLTFTCSTEKIYPCCNYSITNNFFVSGRSISVYFTGISKPEICLTALGPATAAINLGSLEGGTYALSIAVNNHVFRTDLTVSGTSYSIGTPDAPWVIFPEPDLLRVPDGTIWGGVGYHVSGSAHLAQSFVDSLASLGAHTQRYRSGDYGYFVIDSTGTIEPPENGGYHFFRPFILQGPPSLDPVRSLVGRYGKNFGDSLYVSLYGCHGEAFFSWVLRWEGAGGPARR
jgi:hypothetical protein